MKVEFSDPRPPSLNDGELEMLTKKIDQLAVDLHGMLRAVSDRCGDDSRVSQRILVARMHLADVQNHLATLWKAMEVQRQSEPRRDAADR